MTNAIVGRTSETASAPAKIMLARASQTRVLSAYVALGGNR
jgi:hypothetical protein